MSVANLGHMLVEADAQPACSRRGEPNLTKRLATFSGR
jgi:hypothetical protein